MYLCSFYCLGERLWCNEDFSDCKNLSRCVIHASKVLSELGLDFFLMNYRHLLLLKQLLFLISNIIASKETSASHMPFLLLGKINTGVCLLPCDLFELFCFGFVLRSLQELVRAVAAVSVLMAETMLMTSRDLNCLWVK